MNIINKALISLVMLPKFLYRKMGVDSSMLYLILQTKLLIDDRRPNSLHLTRPQKPGKKISFATLGTMILSALMGLFFLISFAIGSNLLTQITIYFSLYIVMLTLTLITDFTSVLIDVRDNQIILPKPVTDKTFVLSRLLHIFIHINKIVLPMSVSGLVFMILRHGVWPAAMLLVAIFLVTIFSIFLINLIYLLILQFTSPQRFKTIISYVQIGMTVAIYGLSQILPRLSNMENVFSIDFTTRAWRWAVPSYWFAAGWNFLSFFKLTAENEIGILLLFIVPIISIYVVVKFLAPSFTSKLAMIASSSEEGSVSKAGAKAKTPGFWTKLSDNLANLLTSGPEEKVAFKLVWKLTGRSRDFKLKVYPGAGYITVIFGLMIFNHYTKSGSNSVQQFIATPGVVLGLTYASGLLLLTSVNQLQYSENYKASWFYLTTPIQNPGHLFSGAIKAAAAKFFVPVILLLSVFEITAFGFIAIPNILLGFSNVMLTCFLISFATFRNFPFSAPQNSGRQTGLMLRVFACTALAGLLGAVHYLIFNIFPVVCIGVVLSILANWLLLSSVRNKSWSVIRSSYND